MRSPNMLKECILETNAPNAGIGAVLIQLDDEGNEIPVMFIPRKLNSAEKNYAITEKECLAKV